MKKALVPILLLCLLASCEKKSGWQPSGPLPSLTVVEGTLTDERGVQEIRVTHPSARLNGEPEPVTGAAVILSDEDSTWILAENNGRPGYYATPGSFMAEPGKHYSLQVHTQSGSFTAKAEMAPGQLFDPLIYEKNGEDDLYHINYVASTFSSGSPAMWEVLLDWSQVPGYTGRDTSECKARLLFYTLPTLDVSQVFAPTVESLSFPAGTVINERRYSLAPGHAAFIRALLLETTWQGGLFNTVPADVPTNLSDGAAGFFAVCAVTELSLTVTP